jgi:hypothetical protein
LATFFFVLLLLFGMVFCFSLFQDNSAVRNLCAASMAEFLKYAVKQTTKKQMADSAFGADRLLQRLKAMLSHPDRHQRTGATQVLVADGFQKCIHIYPESRISKTATRRYGLG